ncbi:hypothetical protein [Pseudodonghicola xiamenensis]|uniref:hypothetical protein n=1 Tax=Pseudodonghicola xiamenensis TaxID=337702 RepID=UPI0012B5F8B2|nr:hypothetical protein [Pseudodonghicola xiamenensis]
MYRYLRLGVGAAIGVSLGAGAAAAASDTSKTYECTLVSQAMGGMVPETVIIFSEDDFKTASVYDNYIHYAELKPIKVIPVPVSEGKYRMNWELNDIKFRTETFKTESTIYLDTKRLRIGFTGTLKGYDNEIRGSGKCALRPPKGAN